MINIVIETNENSMIIEPHTSLIGAILGAWNSKMKAIYSLSIRYGSHYGSHLHFGPHLGLWVIRNG
jgi:hypothetical protein